jgi:hypothetical protein
MYGRFVNEDFDELDATIGVGASPKPGEFYAIEAGNGGLLTITSRAYGVTAGTKERLRLAQKINAHPLNRKFWRSPRNAFERTYFPEGIVSFSPSFTCGEPQRRAGAGESKCYARLFIPPKENLIHQQFGPAIPLPPSAASQFPNPSDACQLLDLGCLDPLDRALIDTGPTDERRPAQDPIGGIPNRWICSLSVIVQDPLARRLWLAGVGTGVRIGPGHILTAGHNLVSNSHINSAWRVTRTVVIGVAFGRDGLLAPETPVSLPWAPGMSSFGAFFVGGQANFWVPEEWEALIARGEHPAQDLMSAFDYGLITFDPRRRCTSVATLVKDREFWGSAGSLTAFSDTSRFWSRVRLGHTLEMTGYPGDKPCEQWGDSGALQRLVSVGKGRFQGTPKHAWLSMDTDTAAGMSGSPIWRRLKGRRTHPLLDRPERLVLTGILSQSDPTGIS